MKMLRRQESGIFTVVNFKSWIKVSPFFNFTKNLHSLRRDTWGVCKHIRMDKNSGTPKNTYGNTNEIIRYTKTNEHSARWAWLLSIRAITLLWHFWLISTFFVLYPFITTPKINK